MLPEIIFQDPILLDDERQSINNSEISFINLPLRKIREEESRILFYLAISAAEDKIFLCYSRINDTDGKELLPSIYISETLGKITGTRVLKLDEYFQDKESVDIYKRVKSGICPLEDAGQAVTISELKFSLIAEAYESSETYAIDMAGKILPDFKSSLNWHSKRYFTNRLNEFDGIIGSKKAGKDGIKPNRKISFSRLSDYLECPQRYFLRYIVKVKKYELPEEIETINPLDLGTLSHNVLEEFFKLQKNKNMLPLKEENINDYMKDLREVFAALKEEVENEGKTGWFLGWEVISGELFDNLSKYLKSEINEASAKSVIPQHFEIGFGLGKEIGPVDYEYKKDEKIYFQGKIDRIDKSDTEIEVIDYKTGRKGKNIGKITRPRELQLPIYIIAASSIFNLNPARIRATYVFLKEDEKKRKQSYAGESFLSEENKIKQSIKVFIKGQEDGFFIRDPREKHCEYCDYKQICIGNLKKDFERKKDDPKTGFYISLWEQ